MISCQNPFLEQLAKGTVLGQFINLLLLALVFGALTSLAAKRKNRDQVAWFWIGFIFNLFGLIAVLIIQPLERHTEEAGHGGAPTSSRKTKKCPDCAEEILLEARVCRFCGHKFTDYELAEHLRVGKQ